MPPNLDHMRRRRFHGLATLEMVLVLPILLFVMALMIIFGVGACWKVRSLGVAREAVWGTRWPRTGFGYSNVRVRDPRPSPQFWPPPASESAVSVGNMEELDDPRVDHEVARGPLALGNDVKADLLDPARGLRRGTAQITRDFPMLGRMGDYDLEANTLLLDDKWRYQEMKMFSNVQRRTTVLYRLAQVDRRLVNAYIQAVTNIRTAPFRSDLRPLHNDEEYIRYAELFGWGGRSPNFHPTLHPRRWRGRAFCSLNRDEANSRVENLTDRIRGNPARGTRGVAERVTSWFRRMYSRAKREYERMLSGIPPEQSNQIHPLQVNI